MEQIEALMRKAETGADWAEICRLEVEMLAMKHPTEEQAAQIETRIERLRAADRHTEADALQREYWDACDLSPDIRAQLEARLTP